MNAVDANKEQILKAERYIWSHPETGYRQWNTSAYMEKIFPTLGYENLTYMDKINYHGDRITYCEDGTATVTLQ